MTLFSKSTDASPAKSTAPRTIILQFDGGSRGNPGPAGLGVTLTSDSGERLYELGESLNHATSNVAEYTALLRGLAAAIAFKATKLLIRADSELVVRQLNGIYKVKSPDLKPLFERARNLISQIPEVEVKHVYRESNSRADALANEAMDARQKIEPLGPLAILASGAAVVGRGAAPAASHPAKSTHAAAAKPAARSPLDLKLIEATPEHTLMLINLSRLYAYDLSEHSSARTPQDGVFDLHPADFWENPHLHAFVIKVNSELAGYGSLLADPDQVNYDLEDFFILRKFRRQKVGTFMLRTLFNRFPGPWSIAQPVDPAARAFLEKVLVPYSAGVSAGSRATYEFDTA
jgi:ribonuclease HI/predicted acetyltransferase